MFRKRLQDRILSLVKIMKLWALSAYAWKNITKLNQNIIKIGTTSIYIYKFKSSFDMIGPAPGPCTIKKFQRKLRRNCLGNILSEAISPLITDP